MTNPLTPHRQVIRDQIALDEATLGYLQPITATARDLLAAPERAAADVQRAGVADVVRAVRAGDIRCP